MGEAIHTNARVAVLENNAPVAALYIVRGKGNRAADFNRLSRLVKQHGEDDKWGKQTRRYLRIGKFKYWVLDEIINRAAPIPSAEVRRRGELWLKGHGKKVGPYGRVVSVKGSGTRNRANRLVQTIRQPFKLVRALVRSLRGTMKFESGGSGGGGTWIIVLPKGNARIPVRTNQVNPLDRLYKPLTARPKTWDDFADDLVPDAAARLKRLVC